MNLATGITFLRFIFAFMLIIDYHMQLHYLLVYWLLALISDYLDGFFARLFAQQTLLGALLDPLADKLLVFSAFYVILHACFDIYVFIPAFVICLRDIYISILRIYQFYYEGNLSGYHVTFLSQSKTAMLMITQFLLLYALEYPNRLVSIVGSVLLYATALMSIYTVVGFNKSHDAPVYT